MQVLVNEYKMVNGFLFGRISSNDIDLKKGKFIKVELVKSYIDRGLDALGIKYIFGTEATQSTAEMIMDEIFAVTCENSDIDPRGKIEKILANYNQSVDLYTPHTTIRHKTCQVSKFTWKIAGRIMTAQLTTFVNTGRFELSVRFKA